MSDDNAIIILDTIAYSPRQWCVDKYEAEAIRQVLKLLESTKERAERAEFNVAKLIAAWPGGGKTSSHYVLLDDDGCFWRHQPKGDPWKTVCEKGPYATREAAVRAAAGLEP